MASKKVGKLNKNNELVVIFNKKEYDLLVNCIANLFTHNIEVAGELKETLESLFVKFHITKEDMIKRVEMLQDKYKRDFVKAEKFIVPGLSKEDREKIIPLSDSKGQEIK